MSREDVEASDKFYMVTGLILAIGCLFGLYGLVRFYIADFLEMVYALIFLEIILDCFYFSVVLSISRALELIV